MENFTNTFGSLVFNDRVIQQRLPKETYKALKKTMVNGKSLNRSIADIVANAKLLGAGISAEMEEETLRKLSRLNTSVFHKAEKLDQVLAKIDEGADWQAQANDYRDHILPAMERLRADIDKMEEICHTKHWPYPSYANLLFYV